MNVKLKNKHIKENLKKLIRRNKGVVGKSTHDLLRCREITYKDFVEIIDNQSVIKWEDIEYVRETVFPKGGNYKCVIETSISYGFNINTDEPFTLYVTYKTNNPYVEFNICSEASLSMTIKGYMLHMEDIDNPKHSLKFSK
jgi:hypothetical protein